MSFPVFFEPYLTDGMCLVDGGLLDNMPVEIARKEGYQRVLAVNVTKFASSSLEELKNGPQIIFRSIECALQAQDQEKRSQADLTLNISIDASLFSFFKQKELIELGEQVTKENNKEIKKFFEGPDG